jgi:hypothetical protein
MRVSSKASVTLPCGVLATLIFMASPVAARGPGAATTGWHSRAALTSAAARPAW